MLVQRHARRGLFSLLVAFALVAFSGSAFAMKIAVVDTQRAIMETEDGLRAQATLKKLFDKRQQELDKKQRDLQAEKEQIEKQRSVLSKAAYQKRAEKWQNDMMKLQQVFVEYNKELQKKEGQLM
ncbi:MAG: OmpH family outer membrane protein, partial [Myxococcales bacterium]|nr:OmpH family outer membrane protein [Myxococcales bacterium]